MHEQFPSPYRPYVGSLALQVTGSFNAGSAMMLRSDQLILPIFLL